VIVDQRARWRSAQQWLARLLELDPEQRRPALAAAALDAELHACVERLLQAADHPDPRLEPDAGGVVLATEAEPRNLLAGHRVGAWELLEEIGRGGMSVVYRARRIGGDFEQVAAVKLLGLAAVGSGGVQRFERERRLLAALRHPHIAQLIDGGVAADGTPFLAMQLVAGSHVDEYCRDHTLDLAARVRLLVQVCEAVAHAHRNLVVHRDIKPGNILVTADGLPVLLDFGIAKLLDDDADATRTWMRALTPGYAAPEQATGAVVSTATDVYALGAVLQRLTQDCAPLPADLRNVIALAMRREPERRYRDAHALGTDLERWLHQRPVLASPDSHGYRLRMFLRRRRGVAIAGSLAVLALVAGIATTLWQAQRASAQARRAEATRDFMVELFEAADTESGGERPPTIADLVDRGVQRIDAAFVDAPALRAEAALLLGRVSMVGGEYAQAETLVGQALAHAGDSGDRAMEATARFMLGDIANRRGAPPEALVHFEAALAALGPGPHADPALRDSILHSYGFALENSGAVERARELARDELEAAERTDPAGRSDPDRRARLQVAAARLETDPQRQLAMLQDAAARFRAGSPSAYEQMTLEANLGGALRKHDPVQALVHLHAAVALAERIYPRAAVHRARLYSNLGSALGAAGRQAEAEQAFARAEADYRALGDAGSPSFAALLNNRGSLLNDLDRAAEAAPLLEEAAAIASSHFGADDFRTGITLNALALARARMGNAAAEDDWRRAQAISEAGTSMPRQVSTLAVGAQVALELGDPALALQRVDAARQRQRELTGAAEPRVLLALAAVCGSAAAATGDNARAQACFGEPVRALAAADDPGTWTHRWRLHRALGEVLEMAGDAAAAAQQYAAALAILGANGMGASTAAQALQAAQDAATRNAAAP